MSVLVYDCSVEGITVASRGLAYLDASRDTSVSVTELPGRDARWVQRSIGVALTSQHSFRMGAVAVRGGKPLGFATNKKRNDPRIVDDWYECSYHAEEALVEPRDVAGAIVYVARLTPQGFAGMAKPCRSCLHLLTASGVKRVVWTQSESTVGVLSLG